MLAARSKMLICGVCVLFAAGRYAAADEALELRMRDRPLDDRVVNTRLARRDDAREKPMPKDSASVVTRRRTNAAATDQIRRQTAAVIRSRRIKKTRAVLVNQ